jgi:hypothetical protein
MCGNCNYAEFQKYASDTVCHFAKCRYTMCHYIEWHGATYITHAWKKLIMDKHSTLFLVTRSVKKEKFTNTGKAFVVWRC